MDTYWRVVSVDGKPMKAEYRIWGHTWHDARMVALKHFHCSYDAVELEEVPDNIMYGFTELVDTDNGVVCRDH